LTQAVDPLSTDTIVACVLAVPGVVGLHPGTFGEVATYLPGRRVVGVRCDGQTVEVHVVLRWGTPVPATADAVRRALTALGASTVNVVVQDVVTVEELVAVPGQAASLRRPP
jgi:uncharacterized alkaline shock family protein YloU